MIKKTITYKAHDGQEHTKDFFFHFSLDELMDMEASHEGGLTTFMTETVKEGNAGKIMTFVKRFIAGSYGVRDGEDFVKDPDAQARFARSPAFDKLFIELATSDERASEFINGVVPEGFVETVNALAAKDAAAGTENVPWAGREPTDKELREMTPDQMRAAWQARTRRQMPPPAASQ